MREDQMEILDKWFASGYVILYLDGKSRVRMSMNCPHDNEGNRQLYEIYKRIEAGLDNGTLEGGSDAVK